jgi:hypothetical protein
LATLLTPYWLKTVSVKPSSGRNRGGATGRWRIPEARWHPIKDGVTHQQVFGPVPKYSQTAATKIIGRWPYR